MTIVWASAEPLPWNRVRARFGSSMPLNQALVVQPIWLVAAPVAPVGLRLKPLLLVPRVTERYSLAPPGLFSRRALLPRGPVPKLMAAPLKRLPFLAAPCEPTLAMVAPEILEPLKS
jgi:hypothetical protein